MFLCIRKRMAFPLGGSIEHLQFFQHSLPAPFSMEVDFWPFCRYCRTARLASSSCDPDQTHPGGMKAVCNFGRGGRSRRGCATIPLYRQVPQTRNQNSSGDRPGLLSGHSPSIIHLMSHPLKPFEPHKNVNFGHIVDVFIKGGGGEYDP